MTASVFNPILICKHTQHVRYLPCQPRFAGNSEDGWWQIMNDEFQKWQKQWIVVATIIVRWIWTIHEAVPTPTQQGVTSYGVVRKIISGASAATSRPKPGSFHAVWGAGSWFRVTGCDHWVGASGSMSKQRYSYWESIVHDSAHVHVSIAYVYKIFKYLSWYLYIIFAF